MGRTGRMWAIEHTGVEPDVLIAAKGIASGLPLGAFMARDELWRWPKGAHGSTYGGSPVPCAAGLATLEVLPRRSCWPTPPPRASCCSRGWPGCGAASPGWSRTSAGPA